MARLKAGDTGIKGRKSTKKQTASPKRRVSKVVMVQGKKTGKAQKATQAKQPQKPEEDTGRKFSLRTVIRRGNARLQQKDRLFLMRSHCATLLREAVAKASNEQGDGLVPALYLGHPRFKGHETELAERLQSYTAVGRCDSTRVSKTAVDTFAIALQTILQRVLEAGRDFLLYRTVLRFEPPKEGEKLTKAQKRRKLHVVKMDATDVDAALRNPLQTTFSQTLIPPVPPREE